MARCAQKVGLLPPEFQAIHAEHLGYLPPAEVLAVATGSQGEWGAALHRLMNQSHMDELEFDDALKYFNPLLQWCMQFSLGMNTLRSIRSVLEPLLLKLVLPNGVTGQSMSVAERLFIELRVSPVIRSFLFPKELDGEAFERYIDGSDLPAVRSQTRLSIGI